MNNPNPNQTFPTNRPSSSTDSGSGAASQIGHHSHKMGRRATKRPHPSPLLNGIPDSWSDTNDAELLCPICFDMLSQPQVTKCGHTFCHDCILRQIEVHSRCPKCTVRLSKDDLSPNFAMNDLINLRKSKSFKLESSQGTSSALALQFENGGGDARESFVSNINKFTLSDIDILMSVLQRKKEILTTESEQARKCLTVDFLKELQRIKLAQKHALDRELELINQDVEYASSSQLSLSSSSNSALLSSSGSLSLTVAGSGSGRQGAISAEGFDSSSVASDAEGIGSGFNTQKLNRGDLDQSSMASMKKRIYVHFEELSQIYLDSRNTLLCDPRLNDNDAEVPSEIDSVSYESLDNFGETLSRIGRYHRLKPLATLSYSADLLSNSNIVSSIEFDKDSEFFAIAGVTKKIKLFEYSTVIGSAVDIHYPSSELTCTAKISCVAWSSYFKNYLASSDYDGCVTQWDAGTAAKIRVFNEHEKRVWSVDWSNGDPKLLASGSDDSKVRLWSTNSERSVSVLEAKANVCCVKFCPQNTYNIAFGSADHCVHYYDFRQPREPLGVLQGHKKAVSYVKFASKDELVSASTDSQLKLWNLQDMNVVRSFTGHTNEKNFVGLATDGNYVACGSENNSLYVYYKALPKPLFSFKFDNHRSMVERPRSDDSTEFVSAVAWKKGSPVVIAANSQGAIKVLELV